MVTWKDKQNREWAIDLTLGTARKLRKATLVDLVDESKVNQIAKLLTDRETLANVLWFLSKDRAESVNVTEDEFFDALDCDALLSGWEGLAEAYINFCQPQARAGLKTAIEKQTEAFAKMGEAIAAQIAGEEVDAEIDKMVKAATAQSLGVIKGAGSSLPS